MLAANGPEQVVSLFHRDAFTLVHRRSEDRATRWYGVVMHLAPVSEILGHKVQMISPRRSTFLRFDRHAREIQQRLR